MMKNEELSHTDSDWYKIRSIEYRTSWNRIYISCGVKISLSVFSATWSVHFEFSRSIFLFIMLLIFSFLRVLKGQYLYSSPLPISNWSSSVQRDVWPTRQGSPDLPQASHSGRRYQNCYKTHKFSKDVKSSSQWKRRTVFECTFLTSDIDASIANM